MEILFAFVVWGIFFGLRIYGAIYCSRKADELNRSAGGWAILGLFFPIVAMILINNLKKKINWHNE